MANVLLGVDLVRDINSDSPVNILLVGPDFPKFENALIKEFETDTTEVAPAQARPSSPSSEKENEGTNGENTMDNELELLIPRKLSVRISKVPILDKEILDGKEIGQVDYIIIFIDPMLHGCLIDAENMLQYIDEIFIRRKRVDFIFLKRSIDVSRVTKEQIWFFCNKHKLYIKTILSDMESSIKHHVLLSSGKVRRIMCNPCMF